MERDKNSEYWGFLGQNEAIKDTTQPDIGKEIILLIYEYCRCFPQLMLVFAWTGENGDFSNTTT